MRHSIARDGIVAGVLGATAVALWFLGVDMIYATPFTTPAGLGRGLLRLFGPILDTDNLGSVQVIGRLLRGRMPGTPRIGLEVVDVRDIADVHTRAMTSTAAAGQRFLATGEFMWMGDIAAVLRGRLGRDAAKVPARTIPDALVRLVALFDPEMRAITPGLGRKNRHTTAKAQELLGWRPRPAADTVADCARSLIENGAA